MEFNVILTIVICAYLVIGVLVYQLVESVADADDPEYPIDLTDKFQFFIVAAFWPIEAVLIMIVCMGKVICELWKTRNER